MNPYWVRTDDEHGRYTGSKRANLPLRIAILPCPRGRHGLQAELRAVRRAGVDGIVSLLTPVEQEELELSGEADAANRAGLRFWSIPVPDHGVPGSVEEFAAAVDEIRGELHGGKAVAAHCYAGIGRSCVLLACVLVAEGWTPESAFERLSVARGLRVPDTLEQEKWVRDYAENLSQGAMQKG